MKIETATYPELEDYFKEILDKNFILEKPLPKTIFDISQYPHYENVLSNWYEFFLDGDGEHGFQGLFLDSLLNLIGRDMRFDFWKVEREKVTDKTGRIDILISDQINENEHPQNAIIIENKVYAELTNDLVDYFNSVKANNKVGIVLTLDNNPIPDLLKEKFVHITHNQWMQEIKKNMGKYILECSEKHLILLKDFIQNIEKLSTFYTMNENIRFYYDNAEKIKELIELKKISEQHLITECYNKIPDKNWHWNRAVPYGISIKYKGNAIIGYIITNEIYITKKFQINFWLFDTNAEELWMRNINENQIKEKYGKNLTINIKFDSKRWVQFAEKNYMITKIEEIENFGDYIKRIITLEWEPLMEYVIAKIESI